MKITHKIYCLFVVSMLFFGQKTFAQHIEGRWDITVTKGDKKSPSWLEVNHSGVKYLNGRFVADGGSSRPISRIYFENNKMTFAIPPQWDSQDVDLKVEATLENDMLKGTMKMPNGDIVNWVGVRAPQMIKTKEPVWGTPIKLFNGKDMSGWNTLGQPSQWIVEKGIMKSPKSGANIRTNGTYNDFKLHVEFKVPEHSNSGVYLRGRYEVQITDSYKKNPDLGELGAIYGFIQPLELPAKAAGEWQSFDVTLVGRVVTVALNGKTIIFKDEIPGITGGAIDSNEAEAGPIMFQGDHGPIEFRNIVLTPAK